MNSTFRVVHRHIRHHHKKYLAGIFGGFAVVKLFLLFFGLTLVQNDITNAQLDNGCVLTGQYYTGEYQTGCIEVPETLTGGYYECETIPGYRTGGTLNESGELVDQIRMDPTIGECILTGQTIIPAYTTGCFMTGGYRTGGTLLCEQQQGTGGQQNTTQLLMTNDQGNKICTSGDISRGAPLAGSVVRDIFSISRNYSGCVLSGATLQLRDHNGQRLTITSLDLGVKTYLFNSRSLYNFQQSGFYHIIGNTGAGYFYLYTGTYTGTYSRFFTGYRLRLINSDQVVLHDEGPFTIDNQSPTLTGVALTLNSANTGYVNLSGVVSLSFTASEPLSNVSVTLGSGKIPMTSTVSNVSYTYTRTLNSLYVQGPLVATISFSDAAGNTGALVYTSTIIFDYTKPTLTGFAFSESDHGLFLKFTASEPVRANFSYRTVGATTVTGTNVSYLTAQQLDLSGIQRDVLYYFTADVFDQAGNSVSLTGDVVRNNLGQITFHTNILSSVDEEELSGSVATFATTLKEEIEKFNICKNALNYTPIDLEIRHTDFILQMPDFKKSQVKMLVNAFTLFVLDKVKKDYKITKADIQELTKRFDNFLVILKLLRDDDNECKQNLSTYHIIQFQRALEEYGIFLD